MGILIETVEGDPRTASHRACAAKRDARRAMECPGEGCYSDSGRTVAVGRTEFANVGEPASAASKTCERASERGRPCDGFALPTQQATDAFATASRRPDLYGPSTSGARNSAREEDERPEKVTRPPKKKWIKEYLEEEPRSPVSVRVVAGLSVTPRSNGLVRPTSPVPPATPPAPLAPAPPVVAIEPVSAPVVPPPAPLLDFEHSRPRTMSNSHGPSQIPSPPSVSSNGSGSGSSGSGSAPRAGTREVHNKLEKNRRAHLKECFELLKQQLPATSDDKKTSNLSILGSAIRYIQVLRRKERECEHEMERLAREKIASQQRLAALKREVSLRSSVRPRSIEAGTEEKDRDDRVNGQVLGIPINITSTAPQSIARIETSAPQTLNLSTKLRTLPIQITPTTSQVVRTSYGTRHNTLTLTTLAPADAATQNGSTVENVVSNALSTTLVHPAQIHLPLSQMVGGGGLVVGPAALQLLSSGGGLRVVQAPAPGAAAAPASIQTNGVAMGDSRIPRENGMVSPIPTSEGVTSGGAGASVVVSGLAPLVVSPPAAAHLLRAHALTHKMVETQVVKGSVAPLTVSAQYLSATTIVKPVVVVSGAHTPPSPST